MNSFKKIMFLFILMFLINISIVKAEIKNIEVDSIKINEKSGTISVEEPVLSSNEIISNVTFNEKDDFVTFELILKNNEDDNYKVSSIEDNNTNDNIIIDYVYDESYVSKGEIFTIKIKLKYNNKLLNVEKVNINDLIIKINLENEEGKSEEIIVNPVTSDNILHYLVLMIISITGLIIIIKKKKKIGSLLLVLPLLLVPFITFAKEKYELDIKFKDIVVNGEFEVYNISIDKGDGSPIEIKQITYGDKLGELPDVSKDGYNFNKWVDNDGNEVTEDTIITGPIEIVGIYDIIEYSITYDLDGGSATNPSTYNVESNDITLNNPTKVGYTFAGWTGSNGDTLQTNVTITSGSIGDKNYKANYSANQDTEYTVTHSYQNLNGTYTDEVVVEHGATATEVVAPLRGKTGFVSPTVQNVLINGDGSSSVTYVYDREEYAFSITDRTYIDNVSTADGVYPYETPITVKALVRPGYTFKWSDNDINYERTFNLTGLTTLTPNYTANTNTQYTVKHYKMNLDRETYTLADIQELTGKTDSEVTPSVNAYDGFTAPATQTITIAGTGDTVLEYYYTRDQYTVSFETDGGSEIASQTISYYDKAVRPSVNPRKFNYLFDNWYTDDTYQTLFDFDNTVITGNTTIYAYYNDDPFPTVFSESGECTFNGSSGVITGSDCSYANGVNKYIDTGINLYSTDNHDKDYEIGFTIVSYDPTEQLRQATFMNTKLEGTNYPGIVFRRKLEDSVYDLSSRNTSSANAQLFINNDKIRKVKIFRIYNEELDTQEIFYSINSGEKIKVNDLSEFNPIFDLSVWFGAAPTNSSATSAQRHLKGTLKGMYIKLGKYYEPEKYTVSFDTGDASPIESQQVSYQGNATRPEVIPAKDGYKFDDWYTDDTYQTLFDFLDYDITGDTVVYAKFEELSTVFNESGECTFNGSSGVITGSNCSYANEVNKYIDTGINLYNTENHDKDYEIGFTIVSYSPSNQVPSATFMNTKLEADGYPGVVFRKRETDNDFDLSSKNTSTQNVRVTLDYVSTKVVKIYRSFNKSTGVQEIYYSINGGNRIKLNDLSKFNPVFDLSVWFGAAPVDETSLTSQRHIRATMKDMYIKLEAD